MSADIAALAYLVSGALFILALRGLSSPETSRRGNLLGMTGMAIAIVTTLVLADIAEGLTWGLIVLGVGLGGGVGAVIARRIPMTAMPQLVAAFHSLVGMAAVLVAAAALNTPDAYGIGTVGEIRSRASSRCPSARPSAPSPSPARWWRSPSCRGSSPAVPSCSPASTCSTPPSGC